MPFWSSLFGGSNPTLSAGIKQAGQTSTFASAKGQGLTSQAGDFYSTLLGGDPAQTAKLLAPQMGAQAKAGQQAKQTMSQFGSRSGGTAARGQTIDDTTRANISNMIATLTGQAAGGAASMGQSLIDTGLRALQMQTDFSQQQMKNWSDSILGKGTTTAVSAAETYALS